MALISDIAGSLDLGGGSLLLQVNQGEREPISIQFVDEEKKSSGHFQLDFLRFHGVRIRRTGSPGRTPRPFQLRSFHFAADYRNSDGFQVASGEQPARSSPAGKPLHGNRSIQRNPKGSFGGRVLESAARKRTDFSRGHNALDRRNATHQRTANCPRLPFDAADSIRSSDWRTGSGTSSRLDRISRKGRKHGKMGVVEGPDSRISRRTGSSRRRWPHNDASSAHIHCKRRDQAGRHRGKCHRRPKRHGDTRCVAGAERERSTCCFGNSRTSSSDSCRLLVGCFLAPGNQRHSELHRKTTLLGRHGRWWRKQPLFPHRKRGWRS